MKNIDFIYLCKTISNLAGIPIRLYQGKKLVFSHSLFDSSKDPVNLYLDEIMKIEDHVGYFVTTHFYYYGIVNADDMKIVLGPTRQMSGDDRELKELAFRADVPVEKTETFISAMKSIIPMPLDTVLQILCSVNYAVNDEKLSLADIYVYDSDKDTLYASLQEQATKERFERVEAQENQSPQNTIALEETLTSIVRNGDLAALAEFKKNAPAVRSGKIASGQLRQLKNIFIVTATLVSRAAIHGGLNGNEALSMSDRYIQHVELIDDIGQIMNLQFKMVSDYTEKVARIRMGRAPSSLVANVANYVQQHLSEQISTEEMAKSLYLSRSRLSTKFKQESGETLTEFILKEKIEEGKRLLRYTDKTVPAISAYLGFSSQSHFSRVFKQITGFTPKEYTKQNR